MVSVKGKFSLSDSQMNGFLYPCFRWEGYLLESHTDFMLLENRISSLGLVSNKEETLPGEKVCV